MLHTLNYNSFLLLDRKRIQDSYIWLVKCHQYQKKKKKVLLHSFVDPSPETEGPGGSWCWGWWGCWCGWVGCGMGEGWGRTLGLSRPCRADRLDPDELGEGPGFSAAPTPAMAGSVSRISLARDSAKSPPPPRSSTSETAVLLQIFPLVYYCCFYNHHHYLYWKQLKQPVKYWSVTSNSVHLFYQFGLLATMILNL